MHESAEKRVPVVNFLVDRETHVVAKVVGVALCVVDVRIAADAMPPLLTAVPPKAATVALLPCTLLRRIPLDRGIRLLHGHQHVVKEIGIGPQERRLVREFLAVNTV